MAGMLGLVSAASARKGSSVDTVVEELATTSSSSAGASIEFDSAAACGVFVLVFFAAGGLELIVSWIKGTLHNKRTAK